MPSRTPSFTTPQAAAGRSAANASMPQRPGLDIVGRERLLARLREARHLRCIAITGPAGAGKSTLVAAWHQTLAPLGVDVAWCAPRVQDDDPARFFQSLLASVAQVDPVLARAAATWPATGMDTDPDAIERRIIALVRGIAVHQRDLVLVLDDLHHLRHTAILDALQWLLDYAPPNLHLVLVSRANVRLSLDRLRSQAQTLEIDQRDLRFTVAESAQFLRSQLGDLAPRVARSLHERSEGWVAGLRLLALEWNSKQQEAGRPAAGQPFAGLPSRDAVALSQYFEQAVCAQLPPTALGMLVQMASCQRVCAPLCAALIGTPDADAAVAEAATLLQRLESEGLFVVRVDKQAADTWYRLHPLLRDALLTRFGALGEPTRQATHARAFAWFRARGLLQDAVHHAVQSGALAQAAVLVDQCAPSLIVRGELRTLAAMLQQLPQEQLQGSVSLGLWLVHAQFFEHDLDGCSNTLEALARTLPMDATAQRFHLAALQTALAVQRDDTDTALTMLPQLLQVPRDADPLAVGMRNNLLSWLHMQQGQYEQARRVLLDAMPLMVDGAPLVATAAGSLHGRCLVGLSYTMEGQMTQAERILRAVAADAEQAGQAGADAHHLALGLLADVLYERGDAHQVHALLENKVDVLERIAMPDAVLRVYRVLAAAHWQAGDPMGAFTHLDRLEAYATPHRLDRLLAHRLADEVHYRLLRGEQTIAQTLMARLAVIDTRHAGQSATGALAEIGEVTQRARIRLAVALGDPAGAAAQLAPLLANCEAHGRQRSVVHLLVRGAALDAQLGREAAARLKLLDALQRGHRLGLLRSLVDADPIARRLLGELAETEPLDPVLAFYVERLLAARTRQQASPDKAKARVQGTGAVGLEAFSEREIDMLRLLAQAMPNKKIARALGLSPETVKWYLSRIYGKLSVSGRDEAVARVRDLGWDAGGPPVPPA